MSRIHNRYIHRGASGFRISIVVWRLAPRSSRRHRSTLGKLRKIFLSLHARCCCSDSHRFIFHLNSLYFNSIPATSASSDQHLDDAAVADSLRAIQMIRAHQGFLYCHVSILFLKSILTHINHYILVRGHAWAKIDPLGLQER
jgi:hypothetical protein